MKTAAKSICLAICLAAVLALAAPASAADNYFVLRGAYGWAADTARTSGGWNADLSFKDVYDVRLAYGRRIVDWLRLELELGYGEYKLDEFRGRNGALDISGKDKQYMGMVNAMFDWQNSSSLTPFVGMGCGVVQSDMSTSGHYPSGGVHHTDDQDTAFAYQVMAGVSWAFASDWDLELMYRFYATNDRNYTDDDNTPNADLDGTRASFVSLGVRFNF